MARDEQIVLDVANQVLARWQQPVLDHLAGLYHPSDEHLLVTFPELDHYGARAGVHYWGAWSGGFGKAPVWPPAAGKKIYAYLKPFPQLAAPLEAIRRSGNPAIIFGNEISADVRQQFQGPTMRFESEPLDIERASRECDVAILNANHGTLVSILRAGKPSLQIPIYVEQSLLAMAVVRMQAGLAAPPDQAAEIEQQFQRLLANVSGMPERSSSLGSMRGLIRTGRSRRSS